jgi:hypothetical protein
MALRTDAWPTAFHHYDGGNSRRRVIGFLHADLHPATGRRMAPAGLLRDDIIEERQVRSYRRILSLLPLPNIADRLTNNYYAQAVQVSPDTRSTRSSTGIE